MLYMDEVSLGSGMSEVTISKNPYGRKGRGGNPHEKFSKHHLFWNSLDPDKAVHAVHYSLYRRHNDVRPGPACGY